MAHPGHRAMTDRDPDYWAKVVKDSAKVLAERDEKRLQDELERIRLAKLPEEQVAILKNLADNYRNVSGDEYKVPSLSIDEMDAMEREAYANANQRYPGPPGDRKRPLNQRGNIIPTIKVNDDNTVSVTTFELDENGAEVGVTREFDKDTGDQIAGPGLGAIDQETGERGFKSGAGKGDIPDRFFDAAGNRLRKSVITKRDDEGKRILDRKGNAVKETIWKTNDGEKYTGDPIPEFLEGGIGDPRAASRRGDRDDQTDVLRLQPSDYQPFGSHQRGYNAPAMYSPAEDLLANTPWGQSNPIDQKENEMDWAEIQRLKDLYTEGISEGISPQDRTALLLMLQRAGLTEQTALNELNLIDRNSRGVTPSDFKLNPSIDNLPWQNTDIPPSQVRSAMPSFGDEGRPGDYVASAAWAPSFNPIESFGRDRWQDENADEIAKAQNLHSSYQDNRNQFQKALENMGWEGDIGSSRTGFREGVRSSTEAGRNELFGNFVNEVIPTDAPNFLRTLLQQTNPRIQSAFELSHALNRAGGGPTLMQGIDELEGLHDFGSSFGDFMRRGQQNPWRANFGQNLTDFLSMANIDDDSTQYATFPDKFREFREGLIQDPSSAFQYIENQRPNRVFSTGLGRNVRQRLFDQAIFDNPDATGLDLLNWSQRPDFKNFANYQYGG